MLLEYAGIPYREELYHTKQQEDGTFDKSEWFDTKFQLGLDFPNLPYLVDGELKLTQTIAILQHCSDRAGLSGKTAHQKARVSMLFGLSQDVRMAYNRAAYNPDFDNLKGNLVKFIGTKLGELEIFQAKSGGTFLTGPDVTYVDLVWYDLLDQFRTLDASCLREDAHPGLVKFYSVVHDLPAIRDFRRSSRFIDRPFNNLTATFK